MEVFWAFIPHNSILKQIDKKEIKMPKFTLVILKDKQSLLWLY